MLSAFHLYPLSLSMPMATLRLTSARAFKTESSTTKPSVAPAIIVAGSTVNKKISILDVVAMNN